MVDGTYQVRMRTPLGVKYGELILHSNDGTLNGSLVVMGKKNIFEPGTTDGKNFNFKGKIQTSVGKTDYVCSGSVNGDELSGIAKTKKGDLALNGIRK